jgi:hypothetical protein
MDARIMGFSKLFGVASLALLAGCATQPSAPTIFGARTVPSEVARADVHMAAGNGAGLTIFGVPAVTPPKTAGGVAVASMP